ncbi:MAG: polysaccharide biosynthesis protein [Bacillales bacterium]|jgi:O-antigen/teichoic acid export membrane protein|nr:polysaccharide biosynthesis protein [Bacillales bacterium]
MNGSKLVKGTFILTAGAMLSKVIGLLYTVPFSRMMSEAGGLDLYAYAYVPYTLFISIATGGLPSAVSKFTAKYNAMGEYATSRKMFKTVQLVTIVTGIMAFAVLFAIAPLLAKSFNDPDFSNEAVASVIRAVSFALIVVPSLSFFRGYFQGHGDMVPTSVSQVIEQIARVLFLLAGVFYAMKVLNEKTILASQLATLGALVGAIAGMLVLFYYWRKNKPKFDELLLNNNRPVLLSNTEMFKEIIKSAIPFVFLSIALPVFQLIDNWTFYRGMSAIGQLKEADNFLSIINIQTQQLVLIPLTLAVSFQISIIPNVSATISQKNFKAFRKILDDTFTILLLILIPATIGMAFFSSEFYTLFYGYHKFGADALRIYAPIIILYGIVGVSGSVLIGMNKNSFTVKSLLIGILVKAVLAIPFIHIFGAVGAISSSGAGYFTVALLNLYMIQKHSNYSFRKIFKRVLLMLIFSAIMLAVLYFEKRVLIEFFAERTTSGAAIVLAFVIPVGAVIYFVLSFYTSLLQVAFGPKLDTIMRKLKLKRKQIVNN